MLTTPTARWTLFRWFALSGALVSVTNCDRPDPSVPTAPYASVADAPALFITDSTPREHMPLEAVVAALQDAQQTAGTLLVGLKEPLAVRGVSTTGEELPLPARFAAYEAIRRAIPDLEIVRGIERVVMGVNPLGSVFADTIYRTFLVVRPLIATNVLQALRDSPFVDYIAPNYTNGIVLGVSNKSTTISAASGDVTPWGINVVRAPEAWSKGYTGGDIMTGLVDTGLDGDPDLHPDLRYPLRFYNLVLL